MLPAPDLDDRTFQDLVDEAKRLVQKNCPTWTDHNVSDPGVTLIEAVAQMVGHLIYRLNRIPDLNYIKFLELIGVELRPPAAARGQATFWLSAPQPQIVLVRAESQVATPRTDVSEPVVFSTTRELPIIPCKFAHAGTQANDHAPVIDVTPIGRDGFLAFSPRPEIDNAMLIGLSQAVPSCAVLLRFDCRVSGRGVDPNNPPIRWEARTASGWVGCEVDSDGTGGLNKPGDVVLHVPDDHQASVISLKPTQEANTKTSVRAGWLRCRLIRPVREVPAYQESPRVLGIEAFTIGGTAPTVNAEVVHREILGRSDGTPAQRFALQRRPVVASDEPLMLTVLVGDEEQTWTEPEVPHFGLSSPKDRHFRIDAYAGEIHFGPAVRTVDGGLRCYGEIPQAGAVLRLESYRTGGGRAGNVAQGQVRVLKTSIPYVSRVENRSSAIGGAEAETLNDAKARGPLLLRSRGRAVTAQDFEELARDVVPGIRVHCLAEPDSSSGVRVLVVPEMAADRLGRIKPADLDPPRQILEQIHSRLDEVRLVGSRLLVQPPAYQWLTVIVDLSSRPGFEPDDVETEVLRTLYRLYHPLIGGPDGKGWPFGRSVQSHEVQATLARIAGVDMSREVSVKLYPVDESSRQSSAEVQRMDLRENELVYSFDHQVRVTR
jgi:predicted phage baseplate assembly protein